jgi:hypothetical protein
MNSPSFTKSLAAVMQDVTQISSEIMRTGKAPAIAPSPIDGVPVALLKDRPEPTGDEAKLAGLLARQQALSADISERAYQEVVTEISILQGKVAAQNGATQQ